MSETEKIAVDRIKQIRDRTAMCIEIGEDEMIVTSSELLQICDLAIKASASHIENELQECRELFRDFRDKRCHGTYSEALSWDEAVLRQIAKLTRATQ